MLNTDNPLAQRTQRRPSRPGFTIVELLTVMVIFGLLVAFAAPRIDVARFRVNSAAQVMGTTMLTAQRQAVTQQHNIIVRFAEDQNRLRIHEDRDNDNVIDANEHERSVQLGEGVVFGKTTAPNMPMGAANVTFNRTIGGLKAVVFHRDGSASEAGGFYITSLRASANGNTPEDARAVVVERATGRTSWHRYRSDGWQKVF